MSTLPFDERYEILSEIGRGGMGVVHAARDRISGAEVVIKTLLHKGESELTSWQRFEREARTLASLRHSSIVTIHDFGRNSQGPYMVMARIRGKDWQSVIQDSLRLGQPPDLALTLRVMGQVAQALSYCHSRDTVHRDLKPSNILVDDSEPGEERALLIDFGLVRGGQEQNQLTRTGELLGTPLYMAPELIDSDHHALAADSNWSRADVWAFGVSLYQSLTGKAPFQGAGAALLAQVAFATPEPISAINPAAPSWLIKLTLACIEKDSKLRPTMPEVELAFRNQSFNATKKNQRQRRLQIVAAILISLITLLALAILFIRPSSPPILIRIESPAISSVPNIQISGQSTSANLIAIRVMPGERRLRAEIDPDGLFQVPVLLSPGPNEISLRLQGPKGWSSPTSLTCIYDNQPPSLDLSETPTTIYGKTLELRASLSETKCRVRGLDQLENQSFSVIDNKLQSRLELHEGLNELSFLITDPAGWSVRASHRVDVRPSFTIGPNGDYKDLDAALAQAPDDCQLTLPPGRYPSPLRFTRKLRLLGLGSRPEEVCLFGNQSSTVIHVADCNISLENLRIETPKALAAAAITVVTGHADLRNCEIRCISEAFGLQAGMPNGELAIASIYGRDIHITGDSRAALYAVNGGSIELDHFSIDAIGMMNAYANSGQITLRSGIAKHGQFAIAIDARVDGKPPACVKAFDSTFAGLKRSAQVAGKNASLQLERCELRESWDSAIALDDRSSLLMLNSKISDCGLGLRMIEASRAELRHCQITACHWLAAILQDPDSELLIERSLISKNLRGHQPLLPIDEQLRAALAVQSGARLIIRDSEISQHKGIGLIVGDSSLALTRNLQMSRNSDGNELVRGSGRIEARGISNEPR